MAIEDVGVLITLIGRRSFNCLADSVRTHPELPPTSRWRARSEISSAQRYRDVGSIDTDMGGAFAPSGSIRKRTPLGAMVTLWSGPIAS